MKTGDIVLIPFPFAELTNVKLRPAMVVCITKDKYEDLVLCAISSVVPAKLGDNELMLNPDKNNKLRVPSVLKIDRIVTLKKEDKVADLGRIVGKELDLFVQKFKALV
jgi:mRNA interferase MazF